MDIIRASQSSSHTSQEIPINTQTDKKEAETVHIDMGRLKASHFRFPKPCEVVIQYFNNPLTSGFAAIGFMLGGGAAGLIWQASIPHILSGIAIGGVTGGAAGSLAYRSISLCSNLKQYILHAITPPQAAQTTPSAQNIELQTIPLKSPVDHPLSEPHKPTRLMANSPESETLLTNKTALIKSKN